MYERGLGADEPTARFQGKNDDHLLNPVVQIEVLSPSTQSYDKGEKFDHYKQLDSLRDYLLIAQDKMQVEHYHRLDKDEWLLRTLSTLDAQIRLGSVNCTLPLSELYEDVELPAGPRPLREQGIEEQSFNEPLPPAGSAR